MLYKKRMKGKKAHNKAVFCSANRFGALPPKSGAAAQAVWRRSRSARFAAWALGSAQLFGRGVLPRLFFLTAARKPGRGAGAFAAAQGYIIICAYKFVMTFCIFKKIC